MKRLSISASNKCPLHCNHCGPESSPNPKDVASLEIEAIKDSILEFQKQGFSVVNFSGGEPMLWGDKLIELIRFSKLQNVRTTLTTGGYWAKDHEITKQKIDKLIDAGLDQICVSLSVIVKT